MTVLGIDGGKSGAIAWIGPKHEVEVFDIPMRPIVVGGAEREELDPLAYLGLLRDLVARGPIDLAFIERNREIPRTGNDGRRRPQSGMYEFGFANGMLVMGVASLGIGYQMVEPQTWKRFFHLLGKDKEASREAASKLFPGGRLLWPNRGHHGRAEAALIGEWGAGRITLRDWSVLS